MHIRLTCCGSLRKSPLCLFIPNCTRCHLLPIQTVVTHLNLLAQNSSKKYHLMINLGHVVIIDINFIAGIKSASPR